MIPSAYAASSPWTQTDWVGGSGQTSWSDSTKYSTGSNITDSTTGQLTLSPTSGWCSNASCDSSWKYRKKITFNNTDANLGVTAENLVNFPVLVKLSSSNIDYTKTQDSGQDIRFTDTDGSDLAYEIEKWDETGTSFVWVKVPQIDINSSTDYIYLYYGNTSATDHQQAASVWNSSYVLVQHLKETSGQHQDSTSNGNNTSEVSVTTQGSAVGLFNGADDFNGNSNYLKVNDSVSLSSIENGATYEIWVKSDLDLRTAGNRGFIQSRPGLVGDMQMISWANKIRVSLGGELGTEWSYDSDWAGSWHYVVGTWSKKIAPVATLLVDGAQKASTTLAGTAVVDELDIARINGANYFDGIIDEIRVSSTVRSSAWIAASYKSESDAFNTFNTEEERYISSGTLTSSIFDSEFTIGAAWGTLTYSSSGSTVAIKARTSNSSSMSGATAFSSCNAITSGTDISSNNCVTDGHRYIQYQLALSTSDTTSTPTFSDISIAFATFDADAPGISLTALATDPNSDTTPTLSGTATDSIGTVSNVQFQMDSTSGSWSSCSASDGSFNSASEAFSCTASTLTDGSHTMYVRAVDSNSNTTASGSESSDAFTIDVTAPASFDLDSPGHNSYTTNERPTFKWKATTDATSGLSSYTLEVDNGSSGDFSITGIPTSRTTDYEVSKYLVHYDNFSDSDSTNNYISIYTKSSSSWGTGENDGKLKEGSVGWKIKAIDNAGNERPEGRTVIVDLTGPALSSLSISDSLGEKNSYHITTDQTPNITGTITDTYYPDKITIAVYKENYFLGALTSTELITTRTQSLSNTSSTSLSFSAPVSQTLDYGSYHTDITGSDKAGNTSGTSTIYFKIMTSGQAQELLQGKISKEEKKTIQETAQVSLPELEKKAILRREKEASEFKKLTQGFSDQINSVTRTASVIASQFTLSVVEGWQSLVVIPDLIGNLYNKSTAWISSPLSVWARAGMTKGIAGNISNVILSEAKNLSSVTTKFGGIVSNQVEIASSAINHGFLAMTETIGKTYNNLALKAPGIIKNSMLAVENRVTTSTHAISRTAAYLTNSISYSNQLALNTLNRSQRNLESQAQKASKETADNFQFSIQNFQSNLNDQISNVKNIANSTGNVIASTNQAISKGLNASQDSFREQIAKTHKNTSDTITQIGINAKDGLSVAMRSVTKPAVDSKNFADRLIKSTTIAVVTFESYMFDKNPTKIDGVALAEVGKDYAIVIWTTNHYTRNNKVNYGQTLTYGQNAWGEAGEKNHRVKITGLKSGEKYYFEVMSQNKNYAYDAYYSFETKK